MITTINRTRLINSLTPRKSKIIGGTYKGVQWVFISDKKDEFFSNLRLLTYILTFARTGRSMVGKLPYTTDLDGKLDYEQEIKSFIDKNT